MRAHRRKFKAGIAGKYDRGGELFSQREKRMKQELAKMGVSRKQQNTVFSKEIPFLNKSEKRLAGLQEMAKTNPVFRSQFETARKKFIGLLEQTIKIVEEEAQKVHHNNESLENLLVNLKHKLVEYNLRAMKK